MVMLKKRVCPWCVPVPARRELRQKPARGKLRPRIITLITFGERSYLEWWRQKLPSPPPPPETVTFFCCRWWRRRRRRRRLAVKKCGMTFYCSKFFLCYRLLSPCQSVWRLPKKDRINTITVRKFRRGVAFLFWWKLARDLPWVLS